MRVVRRVSDSLFRLLSRMPAFAVVLVICLSASSGSAIAKTTFHQVGPVDLAWLRIAVAALILLAWRRPWRTRWSSRQLAWVAGFGVTMAVMNAAYFEAIRYLDLGITISVEFIGPIAVAAVLGRTWRQRVAIVVAAIGMTLLAGLSAHGMGAGRGAVLGLGAVLLAAAAWAGYILIGRHIARGAGPLDAMSLGMGVAALLLAPVSAPSALRTVAGDWSLIAKVVLIAVLCSVVTYVLDQFAMRASSPATYSVLQAMNPVVATVIGLFLGEIPTPLEILGIALIVAAIVLASAEDAAPARGRAADRDQARATA